MNKETVEIEVCVPPWSESDKSWHLLTEKGNTAGAWSGGKWFPKKCCQLDQEKGLLTLPKWLHERLGL